MSRVVEYFPEQHVVVDNYGDIRVPDDYTDGDNSFKEIPDVAVSHDTNKKPDIDKQAQLESDLYYKLLEDEEQKLGAFDLARASLERRGIFEPRRESEPDYGVIAKVGAESIRIAKRDEDIAKVEREIFDPEQRKKAILMIHARYRHDADRRQ